MTGIVGFTYSGDPAAAEAELSAMLAAVQDHTSYAVDRWVGDGIALDRVSLGRLDKQPQPIWNEDHSACVVFEGELVDTAGLRAELTEKGHRFAIGNAAELLLHLWEESGEEGLKRLNGGFMFAVWNACDNSLAVGNDRFGFRHLYYATTGRHLAFACGVRGILAHTATPRRPDFVGISQALHFEHLLGDRTYVDGIKLLPPAAVMYARGEHCTRHRYWHWSLPHVYQPRTRDEYREELVRLFKQAVARQTPVDGVRGGLNLSGGQDSRMLLGLLSTQMDASNLRTFTFGIPDCDDINIGRQLAGKAGTQHQTLPLPPDYLASHGPVGLRLTDGMDSCIHLHSMVNTPSQATQVDFLYTGYYIDSIMDSDGSREWLARFDDETSLRLHYEFMHRIFPNDPDEEVYTPEFLECSKPDFAAAFRQAIIEVKTDTMSGWLESVEMVHRQRRLTQFGNDLLRWQVECRTPFTDTDVLDFCLSVPPALRVDRVLFTETLIASFPKLAKVPNDRTGMPFIVDMRYLSLQSRHNLRYILYQRGLAQKPRHERKLYARYDLWFRGVLRSWVEEILLDPRTLQRGILRPEMIQRIVREHMAGQVDRTREIGMLLSVELWHRAYLP